MSVKNSTNKGIAWLYSEISALLDIWTEDEIQQQLVGRLHNMCVYDKISKRLLELGIQRTGEQCREKIKKLRRDYKTVVDNNYSPAFARKLLGYYDKVDEAFSKCPLTKQAPDIGSNARTKVLKKTVKRNGANNIFLDNTKNKTLTEVTSKDNAKKVMPKLEINAKTAFNIMNKNNCFKNHKLKLLKHQTDKHSKFVALEKLRYNNELLKQRKRLLYLESKRIDARKKEIKLLEALFYDI